MLKIIIIDDEPTVLDGMKYIFNKYMPQYQVIATLQNPGDVFPIMEREPADLVFTDVKMPGLTGVELTGRLHAQYPSTYIVVLSAYPDFDYVRLCLRNGAFDYLLKPPAYQLIIEITQKIEVLVSSYRKEEIRIQNTQWIQSALLKHGELPAPWKNHKELQMFVCLPEPDACAGNNDVPIWINIYEGCLSEGSHPFCVDGYLVVLSCSPIDQAKLLMENCVNGFRHKGYEAYGAHVTFPNEEGAARKALQNCRNMIDFSIFNQISPVITEDEYINYVQNISHVFVSDYISGRQIVNMISTNEASTVDLYLNESFQKMLSKNQYIRPEKLRMGLFKELLIIASEFKNLDMIALTEVNMPAFSPRSRQMVLQWFCEYILKIVELTVGSNLPSYIQQAVEYINSNYMHNISLKDVAEYIHLNQWYFSTQFKKTMTIGFAEYLNRIRINFAKDLLGEKDLKIYQVAELVGFQEPTYFDTVFKKVEGISPKDYQLRMCGK